MYKTSIIFLKLLAISPRQTHHHCAHYPWGLGGAKPANDLDSLVVPPFGYHRGLAEIRRYIHSPLGFEEVEWASGDWNSLVLADGLHSGVVND